MNASKTHIALHFITAFICLMLVGFSQTNCFGQALPDKVDFQPTFLSYKLYQGNVQIGRERMKALMKNCDYSLNEFNSGNSTYGVSTLFQLVGIVCLGGYATDRYLNDNINNNWLIAGGALIAVSIPLNLSSKKQVAKAIANYNINCLNKKN